MSFDLVLYDDTIARSWQPFTLTRPAGELLFGALTFRSRCERILGANCIGYITDELLRDFDEPGVPHATRMSALPRDRNLLFISSRFVPDTLRPQQWTFDATPAVLLCGGDPCGYYCPAGAELPTEEFLLGDGDRVPAGVKSMPVDGHTIAKLWDLIAKNGAQIAHDIATLFPGTQPNDVLTGPGIYRIGGAALIAHATVKCEPGVVFDLTNGPIWLSANVTVKAFTRLAGPSYIGPKTTLLGGVYADISVGPQCKVHGEMEESIVLGCSNKAHDGFLGHAYVGRWVNLGALTTNSDLKNNYGSIRVWTPGGEVDTGETKLGCLLGDHVKTGIGTMLNTGTVVGTGSNIYGSAMPPKYVPPFSWASGDERTEYRLEKFLETAEVAMKRRGVTLSQSQKKMLEAVWLRSRNID